MNSKPITIDISNINPENIKKVKSILQEESFENIASILKNDLKSKIDNKKDISELRIHNTIFLNGERGSGKTIFLLGIERYLKKNHKLKSLYFFNPIDPTILHDNESFLTIIIAKILNNLERQQEKVTSTNKNKKLYNILGKLANSIDGIVNNIGEKKTSLENIAQDQTSLRLEEYMHKFFKTIANILDKKCLVLLIDDVDMAFDKGFEVLEVIRKYLSSPYVTPIVTGDLNLYEIVVENNFHQKLNQSLITDYTKRNKRLVKDYLVKVLPSHRRSRIKTLYELAEKKNIIFEFNNDKYHYKRDIDDNDKKVFRNYIQNLLMKFDTENEIIKDNNFYYFYEIALEVYKAEESAKVFVKNLFSNPLRNLIQFFYSEYKIDKKKFSLTSEINIKMIEDKYSLILSIGVDSKETYLKEAKTYFNKNNWNKAIEFAKKSIDKNPTEDAYDILGNSYNNLYLWEEAEVAYDKVLEFNKENSDAYLKIGDTYRKRKKYEEAIGYYEESLYLNPNNDEVYNRLGICYLHLENKTDLAINYFNKAIKCNPNNPKPYINIMDTSFLVNMRYYDDKFEEDFKEKFYDIKNIMKLYDMFKILNAIRNLELDAIVEDMYNRWKMEYVGVSHPDWSFNELELAIDNEKNLLVKEKFKIYLEKFKENI